MLELSDAARITAGIVLLTVVAIESGGAFLYAVGTGRAPVPASRRRSAGPGTRTPASW